MNYSGLPVFTSSVYPRNPEVNSVSCAVYFRLVNGSTNEFYVHPCP